MKPSLKNYNKKRPVILMVIGDTMLYASTLITTYAVLDGNKTVALISLGLGIGGFFFTKLYAAHTEVIENEDQSVKP